MQSTMVQTDLSTKDFTRYFERKRLGPLYLPNGSLYRNGGGALFGNPVERSQQFHIQLYDLYKLAIGWKVNHTVVPLDAIIAIIAFGSAVRFPQRKTSIVTRRKYIWLGPKIEEEKVEMEVIQPRDVDFFVITEKDLTREETLNHQMGILYGSYGATYTVVSKSGIHILNRGFERLIKGVKENDSVCVSMLQEGVPLFFNGRLKDVYDEAGVRPATPRKIYWDEDKDGYLFGQIQ